MTTGVPNDRRPKRHASLTRSERTHDPALSGTYSQCLLVVHTVSALPLDHDPALSGTYSQCLTSAPRWLIIFNPFIYYFDYAYSQNEDLHYTGQKVVHTIPEGGI